MPTQHEPLKSVLGRTQRSIEAARERHAKRICSEITRRLEELQKVFPNLWYCDGMGTCALWTSKNQGARSTYTDPLYLAFEHVQYRWTESDQPEIECDEDETTQKKAASKIVAEHGQTLWEIITAGRFLDEQCRSYYGAFPESTKGT